MIRQSTFGTILAAFRESFVVGRPASRRWIQSSSTMTSNEVSTALRPFIFIVHPDRFWNHPIEKTANEVSLKRLNEFLGDQINRRSCGKEETITFYLRTNDIKEKNTLSILKMVKIQLSSRETINKTVFKILAECSLSTDYLSKIGKQPKIVNYHGDVSMKQSQSRSSSSNQHDEPLKAFYRRGNDYFYSKELFDEMEGECIKPNVELNLNDWLKENYSIALEKSEASRPVQIELTRLKEEIIEDLNLVDLRWNCDWGASHIRGCLKNLKILGKQYPEDLKRLSSKTIVFSRHSGIGCADQIVLSIEDVRSNWLKLIRSIKSNDPFVTSLPFMEKALSGLLRDIGIVHPEHNVWLAENYVNQLKKFIRCIDEYKRTQGFPSQWPSSMQDYRLLVESENGPLMLSPSGVFIVPAGCPASLFVRFVSEHLGQASQAMSKHRTNVTEERNVSQQCMATFGLECLDKDDNITPEQMIDFGKRLLMKKDQFIPYLKGTNLKVSMYYSVLNDGQMCIPIDFVA